MNKLFILGAIFIVIGFCVSVTARDLGQRKGGRENILYVGGSGPGNYTTINAAVRDAYDGDFIFVYDDSSPYGEADITKQLTIVGENRTTTEVSSFGVFEDKIRITGFTIDGFFYSNMRSSITLDNNIVKNSMGIYAGSFNHFDNNTMYVYYDDFNKWDNNLDFRGQRNSTVIGNTFILEEKASTAINVIYDQDDVIANNTIISHGGLIGINIVYSRMNTFEGNTCIQCGFNLEDTDAYNNSFSKNNVNGKSFLMLNGEANKTIDASNDVGQLFLISCHYMTVRDLNISTVSVGISLLSSDANTVIHNSITNCSIGIKLATCQRNTIERNSIEHNALGISIAGDNLHYFALKPNIVEENNFMHNIRNARFAYTRTLWWHNYWTMPRAFPKVILGTSFTYNYYFNPFQSIPFNIPWVNVDWHPARQPYTI